MINRILITGIALIAVGCSTLSVKDQVIKDYETIDLGAPSGVTSEEAKVIAQKELIDRFLCQDFKLETPKLVEGPKDAPGIDKYWFVRFDETQRSSIPYILIVIVDKRNGKVHLVDDYPADKEWILEFALHGLKIKSK